MTEERPCPQCGTPVPASSPEAICPRCLLLAGLVSEPSASQPAATTPSPLRHEGFVPPAVAEIARAFPQLEIIELIGRGGMGAVYKARQRELDRLVALKILPPDIGSDPAFAQRFNREARALAKLNHPHIVTIFDSGQSGDFYYLLMEFVDGVNLRQTMRTARLSPPEALAIVPQICDALQYAHDEGIVHRDIKPENILVDKRGRVKIADFGLAKLLASGGHESHESASLLTATAQVMGTLRYMAPEQMESSAHVDHRADIYSLGVVFYELLTGEVPMGRFEPPSQRVEIDVRLDEVVLRALEREPAKRYQHASDVKTDLHTVTSSPAIAATARAGAKLASDPGAGRAEFDLDAARQEVKVPALALMFVGVLYLLFSAIPLCVLPALWLLMPIERAPPKDSHALPIGAWRSVPTGGTLAAMSAMDDALALDGPHHELLSAALLAQEAAPAAERGTPTWLGVLLGIVGLALLVQLPLSLLMIAGGWRMQRLESHGLAVLASLVALLPCQPLWPLGLIVGIWSLIVLNRSHVKAAFAANDKQRRQPPTAEQMPSPTIGGRRQSLIDRGQKGQTFPSQTYPRDTADILLVFVTAPLILGVFALLPGGVAMLLGMALGLALWQSVALAGLFGGGVFIVGCIILGTGSVRSIVVDHEGLTVNRFIGPSKFLPWSSVRRIAPISRGQALTQVWLWPGLPPRGSIICMAVSGYQRIDCEGDCWYFCPRNVERFYGAVEYFRAPASETANVELPPPTSARDDVLHLVGGPALGMFGLSFAYVLLGIVLLIVVSLMPSTLNAPATMAPFYSRISIWGATAIFCGASIMLGMIAFAGGRQMLALRSWPVAVTAAVIAAIPLGLLARLPLGVMHFYPLVGVWALVTLLRPRVRAQFSAETGRQALVKEAGQFATPRVAQPKLLWLAGVGGILLIAAGTLLVVRLLSHKPVGDYIIYDVVADTSLALTPIDMEALARAVDRRVNTSIAKIGRVSAGRTREGQVISIGIYGENSNTRQQIIRRMDAAGTLELRVLAHRTVNEKIATLAEETTSDVVTEKRTGEEAAKAVARWIPATARWLEQKFYNENIVTRSSPAGQTEVLVLVGAADVSQGDLKSVQVVTDEIGSPAISVSFNAQGVQRMTKLTSEHVSTEHQSWYLAIIINGRLESSPRIMAPVTKSAILTGRFTDEEAADLAAVLEAGSLPAKLKLSSLTLPPDFDGEWVCVYFERDGVEVIHDSELSSTFSGEEFVVKQRGQIVVAGTSKVNPNKQPQEIDTTYTAGELQGQTIKGIRKIEGERITYCRAASADDPRPTEFTTTPGSGRLLTIYDRRR